MAHDTVVAGMSSVTVMGITGAVVIIGIGIGILINYRHRPKQH